MRYKFLYCHVHVEGFMNPLLCAFRSQWFLGFDNMNNFGLNLEIYFIYNFQLFIIIIIIIILRFYTGIFPAF